MATLTGLSFQDQIRNLDRQLNDIADKRACVSAEISSVQDHLAELRCRAAQLTEEEATITKQMIAIHQQEEWLHDTAQLIAAKSK